MVFFKQLRALCGILVHRLYVRLVLRVIQPVIVEKCAGAAHDIASGEGRDGVVVIVVCEENIRGLRVILHPLAEGDVGVVVQLVVGDILPPHREEGGEYAQKGSHGHEDDAPILFPRGQGIPDKIRDGGAEEQIRHEQQLVVVVGVRLKEDKFAHEPDGDAGQGDFTLLFRAEYQHGKREEKHDSQVFDVKHQVAVAAVRAVGPVEAPPHELLPLGLLKGKAEQLRQGENQYDAQEHAPEEKGLPVLCVYQKIYENADEKAHQSQSDGEDGVSGERVFGLLAVPDQAHREQKQDDGAKPS